MIIIIDYGMGNLGSIRNMLKKIGTPAEISSDPSKISSAEKLVLPGVGAFDHGMTNLSARGLIPLLNRRVLDEKCPILGICLGMQLLSQSSEEGNLPGLGWIAGKTRRFQFLKGMASLKIPHMGWNEVKAADGAPLFIGFDETPRFYFVHSYHVCCDHSEDILATTFYGYDFVSAVKHENIMGTQFHPEKSHKFGMRLLKNFVGLQSA
jgi:glutamine amidotransferase